MIPFLQHLAASLYQQYGQNMASLRIVLPNRRGRLYLKKYLAKSIETPLWVPEIEGAEDFVVRTTGLQMADQVGLLFDLYAVHCELEKEKAQDFDEFISWGQILLHDFNELDLYLADPQQLFYYLDETKVLALWNLNRRPLSEFEQNYLAFYHQLYDYYTRLKARLLEKKRVYQGLAFRVLAENIEQYLDQIPGQSLVFAGFNALTAAEELIIRTLVRESKAKVLWDADKYYLENPDQEAGLFLRRFKKTWVQEFDLLSDSYKTEAKQVYVTGVPGQTGQARLAGNILQRIVAAAKKLNLESIQSVMSKTAIVLADENLLIPLLHSIPTEVGAYNVTMGYPLDKTPAAGFFLQLLEMIEKERRFRRMQLRESNQAAFYYKDVWQFWAHPYFRYMGVADRLVDKQASTEVSQVFYSVEEVCEKFQNSHLKQVVGDLLAVDEEDWQAISRAFLLVTEMLRDAFVKGKSAENRKSSVQEDLELEYLYAFSRIFRKTRQYLVDYPGSRKVAAFRRLLSQLVQQESVSFFGEPLTGLQVMGVLETRNLDFENVIVLSANEDLLPSGKSGQSFVPTEICRSFSMPTYREKNAVYAYHFYRLLQRAKKCWLVYNTEAGAIGSSDRSRFINQMIHELPAYNPRINIQESILVTPPRMGGAKQPITIPKMAAHLEILQKRASGFSPSALNVYRKCSLQFYYRYVVGLDELEQPEESIDASTMGTVVHRVLEEMYLPFVGLNVSPHDVKKMLKTYESHTLSAFKAEYQGSDVGFGKNLLIVKVAQRFVKNFLQMELQALENNHSLRVFGLEQQLEGLLELPETSAGLKVKIAGLIDRIDIVDDVYRIIDYKTGRVEARDLVLKDWGQLNEDLHEKTFQLLVYAWLYRSAHKDVWPLLTAGIFSFRRLSNGLLNLVLPEKEALINLSQLDAFEEILRSLFYELFDVSIPFQQTCELDRCAYCPYKDLCER